MWSLRQSCASLPSLFLLHRHGNPGHPVGYAPPVPKRHSAPAMNSKVRSFRGCNDHGRKVRLGILCMNVAMQINSSALRNPTDRLLVNIQRNERFRFKGRQGPVSWKSRKLFGTEKPLVKFRPAYSVKLVSSYVVKGRKIKITAKFRASRRLRFIRYKENYPKYSWKVSGLSRNGPHLCNLLMVVTPINSLQRVVLELTSKFS